MLSQTKNTGSKNTIEKAQIDWPSTKTQMALAALLIIASCVVAYAGTLKMGFLLDDYLHLDYAARACSGDTGPLLNNFVSNWGGSDIMKSYRPIISFSIFIDYVLYHTHAFGYHLTNLAAFCACSVMVALITLELTGRLGARSGAMTALWAGLLFSVYPLHAESVAWVIGRVDTLATAFYLASVFCFLRLELLNEKIYLLRSLIFFLLALTSKETAVSLPFAIALLSCLPQRKAGAGGTQTADTLERLAKATGEKVKHAFLASLPYWLALAAYAIFRQALLGTAIGGYGGAGLIDLFHSLKIFADKESLIKIFVPVSEEYMPVRALAIYCLAPLIAIAITFLARQLLLFVRCQQKWAPILAPLGTIFWLALAMVPAFQIWHIYPNLVGSRLFFLSSAGFCIAVAMLALPAAEPLGKRLFCLFSIPTLAALSALYLVWFYALQTNLGAWQKASTLVESFEGQLRKIAVPSGQNQIVILNLPQDYKGAGMVGRKLYLDILNRPPFIGVDLSPRLLVVEPKISGSRDYIWPAEWAQAIKAAGPANVYIWSNAEGTLRHFETALAGQNLLSPNGPPGHPDLANAFARKLEETGPNMHSLQAGRWQAVDKTAAVIRKTGEPGDVWYEITRAEKRPDHGKDARADSLGIELPGQINPRLQDNWLLSLDVEDERGVGMAANCKVLWHNANQREAEGAANPYFDRAHGQYLFYLGRYRSFLLSPSTLELGLQWPLTDNSVRFQPGTLKLRSDEDYVPGLTMDIKDQTVNWDARRVIQNAPANSYDEVRFFVTNPGTTIDPSSELDLYQPSALEKATPVLRLPLTSTNGLGGLPLSRLTGAIGEPRQHVHEAIRQIVIVLAGKDGKTVSLPSAPLTVSP